MIEQTNEIVRHFNKTYKKEVLVRAQALVPKMARLPGTDGGMKMSKTLGNCIYLSDSSDVIQKKVMKMYTDPNHLRVEDPGRVEGNPVFTYLDVFGSDEEKIAELKAHYQRGGLGDVVVKRYLNEVLQEFLEPIRVRREEYANNLDAVREVLQKGTERARRTTAKTLSDVRSAMGINYFDPALLSS